jgi:hypothetical protein
MTRFHCVGVFRAVTRFNNMGFLPVVTKSG